MFSPFSLGFAYSTSYLCNSKQTSHFFFSTLYWSGLVDSSVPVDPKIRGNASGVSSTQYQFRFLFFADYSDGLT
jgi:hypothetical protein